MNDPIRREPYRAEPQPTREEVLAHSKELQAWSRALRERYIDLQQLYQVNRAVDARHRADRRF